MHLCQSHDHFFLVNFLSLWYFTYSFIVRFSLFFYVAILRSCERGKSYEEFKLLPKQAITIPANIHYVLDVQPYHSSYISGRYKFG